MDYLRAELLARDAIQDRLAAAEEQRFLRAAQTTTRLPRPLIARMGRLLVVAGRWLEAAAERQRRATSWSLVGDPCHGCAD